MKIIEKEAGVWFTLDRPKISEHSMKEPSMIFSVFFSFTLLSYSHFLTPWLLLHHSWCTNLHPAPSKLYCPSSGKMVTPKCFPHSLKLFTQLHELLTEQTFIWWIFIESMPMWKSQKFLCDPALCHSPYRYIWWNSVWISASADEDILK